MKLYGAIDLHSNQQTLVILDEQDRPVHRRRLPNVLEMVLAELAPFQRELEGVVVESTYNWYWLVDGLQEAGYRVHLANTAALEQYEGLKHGDDETDAQWLAHCLRLGLLPEGYIYPKETRPVRDLLRKRAQLVRQRTADILSIENLTSRNTGVQINGNQVKQLTVAAVSEQYADADLALPVESTLAVIEVLNQQIHLIEKRVKARAQLAEEFQPLLTVSGVGQILGLTIMLETGDVGRFAQVGDFASYCRCVDSLRLSNGKKKGSGNRKCGNKYLAWAFMEAANFAIRYDLGVKRFYQRKKARSNVAVARKAVAHKLARASYYVMRDRIPFQVEKCFGR
jgi:transposase